MYDLLISAPAADGIDRAEFEQQYATVHSSLVACIPGLVRSVQTARTRPDGTATGACALRFVSAKAASDAMMSTEWVDLLDETSDLIAWDAVSMTSGSDVPRDVWDAGFPPASTAFAATAA